MIRRRSLILGFSIGVLLCNLQPNFAVAEENSLNFNIPAPPHSSLLDTKELRIANHKVDNVLYGSTESPDTVAVYYRNFFQQQGFQKTADSLDEKKKKLLLGFKRNELVVNIAVVVKEDNTQVVVTRYLQPAGEPPLEKLKPSVKDTLFALPKEDASGHDLADVPRPPNSVRMMSMNRSSGVMLMYTTTLDVAAAVNFYHEQMPAEWAFTNEVPAKQALDAYKQATGKKSLGIKSPFSDGEDFEQVISDSYVLNFKSDYASCQITVFPNFFDRKLGSMVQITYSEKTQS